MVTAPIAPFLAPRLKLARAKEHQQELEAQILSYMENDPLQLIVEPWDLNDKLYFKSHAWVVRVRKNVPLIISSIFGDAIHNIRSSLDLLACDLVRLRGKDIKGVYFPFCDRACDLDEMIKRRNIHRAGPEVVEAIKSAKPCKDGNKNLRAIHDLDILDKHQTLLPVIEAGTSPKLLLKFFGNAPVEIPSFASIVEHDGQSLIVMPPVAELPVGTIVPAAWHIVLGPEAIPFAEHEITFTLKRLLITAEDVVESFALKFGAPQG